MSDALWKFFDEGNDLPPSDETSLPGVAVEQEEEVEKVDDWDAPWDGVPFDEKNLPEDDV